MRWIVWLTVLVSFGLSAQQQQQQGPRRVTLKGGVERHRRIEGGGGSSMKPENGACPPATNGWVLVYEAEGECRYWHAWPAKGEGLPPITPDGRGGGGRCQFCPEPSNEPPWEDPYKPAGPGDPRLYRPANSVPGGYDPCKNPVPPLACRQKQDQPPPQQQPQKPARDYFKDRAERTEGFKQGLRDCIEDLKALPGALFNITYDIGYATVLLGAGDVNGAGRQLGMERIPQAIASEFTHPTVGANPHDEGRRMAQRLCGYGLAPQFGKGAGKLVKKGTGPGSSAFKPMKARDVHKSLRPSSDLRAMEGNWVDLGNGPVELGKLRGAGSYGAVYDVASGPGAGKHVVKLSRDADVRPLKDQLTGYQELKDHAPGVGTPEIRSSHWGNGDVPAHLVMDDYRKAFRVVDAKGGAADGAVRRMNTHLGAGDIVWVDGHAENVFYYRDAGGALRAGALDTDMMYRSADSLGQRAVVKGKEAILTDYFKSQGIPFSGTRPPALGFMQAMNKAFFSH